MTGGTVPPPRVGHLRRIMRRHDGSVDACIVGCGAAGSVLAKELAEGGMSVVVLEAGDWLDSREDFVNDELSIAVLQLEMMLESGAVEGATRESLEESLDACRKAAESLRQVWIILGPRQPA